MRINPDVVLTGSRVGDAAGRRPRIPSERSDVAMLTTALASLCDQVVDVLGPPGSHPHLPLRTAVYTARNAIYRATVNRDHRDARKPRQKKAA